MHKKYSPVRIKNPENKHVLIRLWDGQSLDLIFDKQEFQEHKIDIVGHYLSVADVKQITNGWMATIVQQIDTNHPYDNTFFLGGVNLYDLNNKNSASLCVVTNHQNTDILTINNPKHLCCNLEVNQLLDVVFHSQDIHEKWSVYPSGMNICVEQLQYVVRQAKAQPSNVFEHFFRFRFNMSSVQYISEQPYGKYDGGHLLFCNNKNERSLVKLTCCWRGKNSAYKALLVPRMPQASTATSLFKKLKKQAMQSDVKLTMVKEKKLDYGCNVIVSKA